MGLSRLLLLSLFSFGLCNANIKATPLNLTLGASPDIYSDATAVSYDFMSMQLSVNGSAELLKPNNITDGMFGSGTFSLTAMIDHGGVLSGGSLSILGQVGPYNSGTLLSGTLTAFGFNGQFAPFEFLFTATGGDLMSLYGSNGGIILNLGGGTFNGSFSGDFDNDFGDPSMAMGYSDTGITPSVPDSGSTLLLLGFGFISLAVIRKALRFAFA